MNRVCVCVCVCGACVYIASVCCLWDTCVKYGGCGWYTWMEGARYMCVWCRCVLGVFSFACCVLIVHVICECQVDLPSHVIILLTLLYFS